MIVSLLQLMGFPMVKPVHSRAEDTSVPAAPPESASGAPALKQLEMGTARRSDVKATSKATSKASGKDSKKGAKAPIEVSSVPKKAAKSERAVKSDKSEKSQKAPKALKSEAAVKASKPEKVAKVEKTKKVESSPKAAKAEIVPAKKTEKTPAKATKTSKTLAGKGPVETIAVVSAPVETTKINTVAAGAAVASAGVQRSGRPSSRLAQLTVPSMAQSVASTAAKASYSQSIPPTVIVPALSTSIKKDAKLANNWKSKPVAEITDAELLAMSDDDYMNEVQLAVFRLKLQALRQTILNSAGETTEHLREDTSVVPDPADRATIEEEHALELRTRDRERKLLKKIEQSIARIDAGDYGYCDETGEPIGVGRLLARPTATLSLEAQQRRELKQKMFGD